MSPRFQIEGHDHDHVDGSDAVQDEYQELSRLSGIPQQERWSNERVRAYFADVHSDLVAKFTFSTRLLQTPETLELMGYAYGRRRAKEGYVYVEGQFAPQYSVTKDNGLTIRTAVHYMMRGMRRAEREFGIRIVPVVDIGREVEPDVGEAIARVVLDYDGAVMLGLACDEAGHPPEKHLPAFAMTFGTKVRRTCHAGEWVKAEPAATYRSRLLENVRTAVRVLKCHDVGHAIPLCDDDELIREVVDKGIRISGCPLSNKTTGKIKDVRELQIDKLLDAGVYYTLNADDDLFLPNMDEVIAECDEAYRFTDSQIEALQVNSLLFHRLAGSLRPPRI